MKTIEEKAQAYDEALARAKKLCEYPTTQPFVSTLEEIFPELAESNDEKIRKALIGELNTYFDKDTKIDGFSIERIIAWLEDQGQHYKFRNGIQIGDKVTRNDAGVLVNLSQLKRVAKPNEKQAEQKPAWSEEDERMFNSCCAAVAAADYYTLDDKQDIEDWLKSIRQKLKGE